MAICVNLDTEDIGTYHAMDDGGDAVSGSETTLETYTVPSDKVWTLFQLEISSFHPGVFYVLQDTTVILEGRLNAAAVSVIVPFQPRKDVASDAEVKINFLGRAGLSPPGRVSYVLSGYLVDT